jgi:hypothetical protein
MKEIHYVISDVIGMAHNLIILHVVANPFSQNVRYKLIVTVKSSDTDVHIFYVRELLVIRK